MLLLTRFILAGTLLLTACGKTSFGGRTMGTTWSLKTAQSTAADVGDEVQRELDRYEAMLSNWRADSPVSRFNASRSTEWQPMPAEVIEIVEIAKRIADDTDGALDITLGPLIDLWGFGAHGRRITPPTDEDIQSAKKQCGWSHLEWSAEPPALRKKLPEVEINLSSVIEGWVLERLAKRLQGDFLLEIGGEVLARGFSAPGSPWRVGVQTPDAPSGDVMQTLPLSNATLATSGTYRQHFEDAGSTFAHVLDPRTGRPVHHSLRAVSVMNDSAILADGYATALLVVGPHKGRVVAEGLRLRVIWIE